MFKDQHSLLKSLFSGNAGTVFLILDIGLPVQIPGFFGNARSSDLANPACPCCLFLLDLVSIALRVLKLATVSCLGLSVAHNQQLPFA